MDKTDLAGSYFLGPPLPLGGKLYVLTEKNAELRLVCLNAVNGEPTWEQTLATPRDRLLLDVSRRVQAVHLAYGEGILVCPTNAGAILGVDRRRAAWSGLFPTAKNPPTPPALRCPDSSAAGGDAPGMNVMGLGRFCQPSETEWRLEVIGAYY